MATRYKSAHRYGVCRYCGCTAMRGCFFGYALATMLPVTCSWINHERNVCSAPDCVRQYQKELESAPATIEVTGHQVEKIATAGGYRLQRKESA